MMVYMLLISLDQSYIYIVLNKKKCQYIGAQNVDIDFLFVLNNFMGRLRFKENKIIISFLKVNKVSELLYKFTLIKL